MSTPAAQRAAPSAPHHPDVVSAVLASCLDIVSVWSIDHEPAASCVDLPYRRLLAFADARTLRRLRADEYLHSADVEFLVVVDGDAFASAWGPSRLSGSLARWAWRQTTTHEAYYDESRWAGGEGAVIRARRKAFLLWQRPNM
jgi:hypothetical protein